MGPRAEKDARLEVVAAAASMCGRPAEAQRCQLAGAWSTWWGRCPGRPRASVARSHASAPVRRLRRRAAVPLPCLQPDLGPWHLTLADGMTQDPRSAHKEAVAAGGGPSINRQAGRKPQSAGRLPGRAPGAARGARMLHMTWKWPYTCQPRLRTAPVAHLSGGRAGSDGRCALRARSPFACPTPGAPG